MTSGTSGRLSEKISEINFPDIRLDYFRQHRVSPLISPQVEIIIRMIEYDDEKVIPPSLSSSPSLLSQKSTIDRILGENNKPKDYEIWCVISRKWFDKWKSWVGGKNHQGIHPGPIDNLELLEIAPDTEKKKIISKLKKSYMKNVDFEIIPSSAWDLLLKWYGGICEGQAPTISRSTCRNHGKCEVELYPIFFNCVSSGEILRRNDQDHFNKISSIPFVLMRFNTTSLSVQHVLRTLMILSGINPSGSWCRVADVKLLHGSFGLPFVQVGSTESGTILRYGAEFMDRIYWNQSLSEWAKNTGQRELRDCDFLILEPRFLTVHYFSEKVYSRPYTGNYSYFQSANTTNLHVSYNGNETPCWDKKPFFTNYVTLPPPRSPELGISNYIHEVVVKKWFEEFNIETIEETNMKKLMKVFSSFSHNPPKIGSGCRCFITFRMIAEHDYREFVVVRIMPEKEKDIDEVERTGYLIEMDFNLEGVHILKITSYQFEFQVFKFLCM